MFAPAGRAGGAAADTPSWRWSVSSLETARAVSFVRAASAAGMKKRGAATESGGTFIRASCGARSAVVFSRWLPIGLFS
jgi:hypothetical protein